MNWGSAPNHFSKAHIHIQRSLRPNFATYKISGIIVIDFRRVRFWIYRMFGYKILFLFPMKSVGKVLMVDLGFKYESDHQMHITTRKKGLSLLFPFYE